MTKKINCTECSRSCGEIRDASLLKGLKFICPTCESKRIKKKVGEFINKENGTSDFLEQVFGMK